MDITTSPVMVVIPGRSPMPLVPARGRPVTAEKPAPAPYTAPGPPRLPAAPQPLRVRAKGPEPKVKPKEPPKAPVILYVPPTPSLQVEPSWRLVFTARVEMAQKAAPAPKAPAPPPYVPTNFATYVGLIPSGGTFVTSTPANLLIGPVTYIADFTIHALDAGTYL